uniref:Cystatin domain-containing protein n=1 Tax=Suricata suricatta TaxID=37032 RepID=A0A673TNZ8_SURSU
TLPARPALGEKGREGVAAVFLAAEAGDWVTCPNYTTSEELFSLEHRGAGDALPSLESQPRVAGGDLEGPHSTSFNFSDGGGLTCLHGDTASGLWTVSDFCSQTLNSDVKPGFPKTISPSDPAVLKAARHSVERFNNCTNDIFLFKESHISRAMVQIVKGLKYMLEMEIGRTSCKKTQHPSLDNCDFQTNHTLQRTFSCYSEVWVIPWLQRFEVPVLHCQ